MRVKFILFIFALAGCQAKVPSFQTKVSIQGEKWHINGEVVNEGSPAEGLLMNVRMVNAVFEDRGEKWKEKVGKFDPKQNTEQFIAKIPEYVNQGVNAFVISLQGGMPGYEGAINSAFEVDGKIRDSYMERVERVVEASDRSGAVVILSCLYQRQRGHDYALGNKESIIRAIENTAQWIKAKGYTNVILEVANEFPHGGFKGWPDAEWLISNQGQIDLIRTAKRVYPRLLVSTSGLGHGRFPESLIPEVDYILIHFNNTSLADYEDKINALKGHGKPIVCNEDDKVGEEGAAALGLAVYHGAAWGFMHSEINQHMPFEFNGKEDDPAVYEMYRRVSTVGEDLLIDELEQPSLTITSPNDGNRFKEGETIEVTFKGMFLEKLENPQIVFRVNEEEEARGVHESISWQPSQPGDYFIYLEVYDKGVLVYTSAPVDLVVE